MPKSRNVVILLACCLLSCLCLLVWLSACLYLDDEMTLLYFPSFPLLPLLYCTSSTVDSSPSLVYCAAVLCILLVIATRKGEQRRTKEASLIAVGVGAAAAAVQKNRTLVDNDDPAILLRG